jgi:MEMO1 family protein
VLVPLLPLMDGSRDGSQLALSFTVRTGTSLPPETLAAIVNALDEALLLENERFQRALQAARHAFRRRPFREPAFAGQSYPAAPSAVDALFETFAAAVGGNPAVQPLGQIARASGVLSPHIDYARGGPVYASTWQATVEALASAEVVVVFGTDHRGSAGHLTLTTQRYATPWGTLATDLEVVHALARNLGERAFAEELHHAHEHAIELAAVWLHWALRRAGVPDACLPSIVPVLCGSFHCYTRALPDDGTCDPTAEKGSTPLPEDDPILGDALQTLVTALEKRRVFVVSAADLAHVGPAFGDSTPLSQNERTRVSDKDAALLETVAAGDATALLTLLRDEQDRWRVCGLPPTYWAMRLLERLNRRRVAGRITRYDQCAADERFDSLVSIAGAVWE